MLCKVKISLTEALCGFDKAIVTHLDGRGIRVKNLPGNVIKPGMVKRVSNEGMPTYKRPDNRGDLYIQFDVEFPDDGFAAVEKLKGLETILPKGSTNASEKHDIVDECHLMSATLEAFGSSSQSRNAYDEDDSDEEEDGQGGIRCAQQ